ncbi:MAG: response regulator [Phycisphaerales bacterium]|nr:response regulator [Phycisphaerales bacterium]
MSRIIVAEDDAGIRRVITMWLERQGHEVRSLTNGREALDACVSSPPDVLISDVNMPEIDGIQLIEQLSARGLAPRGVVVLTSRWDHAQIGERLAGLNAHVLPKPFSPARLADLVEGITAAMNEPLRSRPVGERA